MTTLLEPLPAVQPGAWQCTLRREDAPVPHGVGSGKGAPNVALVGAVFEALEHHFSCGVPSPQEHLRPRRAHQFRIGPLGRDAALSMLAEGPDDPLACIPYQSLTGDTELDVPVFLSMPDYLEERHAPARAVLGDTYDYTALARYSMNSGWAAGITTTDATVHALNEIIERDAMSMLLIDQFLSPQPAPLRLIDPATLPPELAALHHTAQTRLNTQVSLLDMTTDLGVPAFWAYVRAPHNQPARLRGCGASLSARYALERSLTELIQIHSGLHSLRTHKTHPLPEPTVHTQPYPALHRCYLADFSTALTNATPITFTDTPTPTTPHGHLETLLEQLQRHGYNAWQWRRYTSQHLAVLNVLIPGLERFMLVTDGQVVLPGTRGNHLLTQSRNQAPHSAPTGVIR
jgi:ribosomal protein S12 methylthiotransferase accessory factor